MDTEHVAARLDRIVRVTPEDRPTAAPEEHATDMYCSLPMSEAKRRFYAALRRRAPGAELDLLLLDVWTELAIRRLARDIADGTIPVAQLAIVHDLIRAAQELCS